MEKQGRKNLVLDDFTSCLKLSAVLLVCRYTPMFAGDIGMSCEERTCAAPVQHTTEKPLLAWIQSQFLADFTQYLTFFNLDGEDFANFHY